MIEESSLVLEAIRLRTRKSYGVCCPTSDECTSSTIVLVTKVEFEDLERLRRTRDLVDRYYAQPLDVMANRAIALTSRGWA